MTEATTTGEHRFEADVSQVLDIVIHSLYSHPEIFLRELISNAADAIDKLRVQALTEHDLLGDDTELRVELVPDEDGQVLTITDNGVGMSAEDLTQNLGTIAHSGSRKFVELLKEKGQDAANVDLIGQFGVGFYSAFLVASRVEVTSRAAGAEQAYRWTSEATGTFEIEETDDGPARGTEVKLFVKDEHKEFLQEMRLRHLVRQYSDFVQHPIRLQVTREEGEGDDKKTVVDFETLNQGQALWKRPKDEITDEQYQEFYKHVTHDYQDALARNHFTVEGTQMFTGLIFVPQAAPFDLFSANKRRGVRLYVKRVFIMDDCEELVPEWLRFVRGIIDSDDLPLNVSRELLQEDRVVKTIRKVLTRKTLDTLTELADERPDDYATFWDQFGAVLKEGLYYDAEQRDTLAELVRYVSTAEERTSLKKYVERMPDGQKAIYYINAPDLKTAQGSPHIEALRQREFEVLYMTDPVDEWALQGLSEYDGKPLVSASQANLDLDGDESADDDDKKEEFDPKLEGLQERVKNLLGETVSEVRLSRRLTESPCCLVTPEGGMPAHIERMMRARQQGMPPTPRIFEINPDHPVIQRLGDIHLDPDQGPEAEEWIHLLYDQALLAEGSPIDDPAAFARRMSALMTRALGDEEDESAEEAEA